MTGRDVRNLRIGDFIADGLFISAAGNGYPGYGTVRVYYGNGAETPLSFDADNAHLDGDLSVGGRIIGLLDCLSDAAPNDPAATPSPGVSTNVARYDHRHVHQSIAISGDATADGTTELSLTLATVNPNAGSFGGAAKAAVFTVDGKGRITAAGEAPITPASIGAPPSGRSVTGGGILTGGGDLTGDRVITAADVAQNTVLGRTAAGMGAPSAISTPMIAVAAAADAAAARGVLALGSAATCAAGTSAGNVLQLPSDNTLPALNGAALTGVSAVPASAVISTAVNLALDAGHNGKAINCTAAVTITLPAASGLPAGWSVRVKPAGGDVTIQRAGSDQIDGGTAIIQPKIAWGSAVRSVTIMVASSSGFVSL
jgi:hypothetical protein